MAVDAVGDGVRLVLGMVVNVGTVVGIVMCNKWIQTAHGFRFPVFMSCLHFVFTSIGTRVLLALDLFEFKPAATVSVLPMALGSLGSVAFNNLNLANNSIGFYQVSKLACIPVTLLVNKFVYATPTSTMVKLSLVPLLLGVGLATVYDVTCTARGSAFAAAAVLCTVFSQIFTSKHQKALECDALQMLHHTAPLITVGMAVLCPFFDNVPGLLEFEWHALLLRDVLLSCVFAFGVNVSNYMVLRLTGPLTYQVLGHVKTILILVLGFAFFGQATPDPKMVVGICLAMVGVVWYTELKRRGADKPLPPLQPLEVFPTKV